MGIVKRLNKCTAWLFVSGWALGHMGTKTQSLPLGNSQAVGKERLRTHLHGEKHGQRCYGAKHGGCGDGSREATREGLGRLQGMMMAELRLEGSV